MSSLRFCSSNCGRTVDPERNDSHCCQQCVTSHGNISNHGFKCDQLYNEFLIAQFTENEEKNDDISNQWICSKCTYKNKYFRTKCEMCNTSKSLKKSRKRKHDQISMDDDDDDDDIIILNSNKKRKLNENSNNSLNHNENSNNYHNILKISDNDHDYDDEDTLDPELKEIKKYHEMREEKLNNIPIPGDYMIDYELIKGKREKLTCFHHEKVIRIEQNEKFKKYEYQIKQLNDTINKKPKQVFNWKLIEYIMHENKQNENNNNKQIIQLKKPKNRNNKLPFSENTDVLLFCSCSLIQKKDEIKSTLTQEQREMIEKKRKAALQKLAKNGIRPNQHKKKPKNKIINVQELIKNNHVLYGKVKDIETNNNMDYIITVRMNKFNKYLSEYGADFNHDIDTKFHDKNDCHWNVCNKLDQFTTFAMELKSIETFFSSTIHQFGSVWSQKYYYIENKDIGNGPSLVTNAEIMDVMKENKLLKTLYFPIDIMHLITNFIGEPTEYEDILTMNNDLNASQIRAIYNSLTNPVSVIQGPPGTGKTFTAINIIQKLFHSNDMEEKTAKNKRVICSAHTHAACDQILDEMVKYPGTQYLDITRFANPSDMKAKHLIRFSYREQMKNHQDYDRMTDYFQASKLRRDLSRSQREDLRSMAEDLEKSIIKDILKNAQIIIITCYASNRRIFDDDDINIDMVIIDEATQILETEVIGVLNLLQNNKGRINDIKYTQRRDNYIEREINGSDDFEPTFPGTLSKYIRNKKIRKRIIMIGDPKQLSPIVGHQDAENKGRGITWFHRILCKMSMNELIDGKYINNECEMKNDNDIYTMLNVQYRGWDILYEFNSQQFYNGKLKHDQIWNTNNKQQLIGGFEWKNNVPFNFLNVMNSKQRRTFGSYDNPKEVEIIVNIVRNLLNYGWNVMDRDNVIKIKKMEQIGIVTWHKKQEETLKEKMKRIFDPQIVKDLMISTVDAFQGQQKDIIIISLTRTDNRNSKFMRDITRINVGLSRAKKAMIIVGYIKQLETNHTFKSLRQYLQSHGLIKDVFA